MNESKSFSKYIDKINIDSDEFRISKEEGSIRLEFINGLLLDDGFMVEDGGDYVYIYLPLPLRFDQEWFEKYKKVNLNEDTIRNCISEEYIKV